VWRPQTLGTKAQDRDTLSRAWPVYQCAGPWSQLPRLHYSFWAANGSPHSQKAPTPGHGVFTNRSLCTPCCNAGKREKGKARLCFQLWVLCRLIVTTPYLLAE
jgi:hypothetical protein